MSKGDTVWKSSPLDHIQDVLTLQKEVDISERLHGVNPRYFADLRLAEVDQRVEITWNQRRYITLYHYLRECEAPEFLRQPRDVVIGLMTQFVECVQIMHEAGIVHFGLNPKSVYIDPVTTNLLVNDFSRALHWRSINIATDARRALQIVHSDESTNNAYRCQYVAPELFPSPTGHLCDYRADLYSMGILFYELLVGEPPFSHFLSVRQLHVAHQEIAPSPLLFQMEDITNRCWNSPALAAMIHKLLQKDPCQRYNSAHAFLLDLQQLDNIELPSATALFSRQTMSNKQESTDRGLQNFHHEKRRQSVNHSLDDLPTSFSACTNDADSEEEGCLTPRVNRVHQNSAKSKENTPIRQLGVQAPRSFMKMAARAFGITRLVDTIVEYYHKMIPTKHSVSLFIEGASGTGKSTLTNAAVQAILAHRLPPELLIKTDLTDSASEVPQLIVARGKFERMNNAPPLVPIRAVFEQILQGSIELYGTDKVRETILMHMSELNVQILKDQLISGMSLLFPEQFAIMSLSASENRARLENAVGWWMVAMSSLNDLLPLVIVLDDLQWATETCTSLLKNVMSNPDVHCLYLLPHRPLAELSEAFCVEQLFNQLAHYSFMLHERMVVKGFQLRDTVELMNDMMGCESKFLMPLAEVLQRNTLGNPFFVSQFIANAYDENAIYFDHDALQWHWDSAVLNDMVSQHEPIHLVIRDLERLPPEAREILEIASCSESHFEVHDLALISRHSLLEVTRAIRHAEYHGLIYSQYRRRFNVNVPELGHSTNAVPHDILLVYRFAHNRIQEGFYANLDAKRRKELHFLVGSLLLSHASATTDHIVGQQLFGIARHLNEAHELILKDTAKAQELIEINKRAADLAASTGGFRQALAISKHNVRLLHALYGSELMWQEHHDMAMQSYGLISESHFLLQEFDQSEEAFGIALEHTQSIQEKVQIGKIRLALYNVVADYRSCLTVGLELLNSMGANVKEGQPPSLVVKETVKLSKKLKTMGGFQLFERLPHQNNPDIVLFHEIAASILPSAFFYGDVTLYGLIPLLGCKLCLEQKVATRTVSAQIAFLAFSLQAIRRPSKKLVQMIQVAWRMAKDFNDPFSTSHAANGVLLVSHMDKKCTWKEMEKRSRSCRAAALEVHNIATLAYILAVRSFATTYYSIPLPDVMKEMITISAEMEFYRRLDTLTTVQGTYCSAYLLSYGILPTEFPPGLTPFTVEDIINSPSPFRTCGLLEIMKAYYILDQTDRALEILAILEPIICYMKGTPPALEYEFWSTLVFLKKPGVSMADQLKRVREQLAILRVYANVCPPYWECKYLCIRAENRRLQGKSAEQVMGYYEQAFAASRPRDLCAVGAIVMERLLSYHQELGLTVLSKAIHEEAMTQYRMWGATAKCELLRGQYSCSLSKSTQLEYSPNTSQLLLHSEMLERISNLITQGTDVRQMMRIIAGILHSDASAEEGYIFCTQANSIFCVLQWKGKEIFTYSLPQNQSQRACVRLDSLEDQVPVDVLQRICTVEQLSKKYTERRLNDHMRKNQIKSLQCLPLRNNSHVFGALYLVNRSSFDAFAYVQRIIEHLVHQISVIVEYHFLSNSLNYVLHRARAKNQQLERINEMKSSFVQAISEELRTPLNEILHNLGNLEELDVDLDQTQLVEMIKSSTQGLLVVISDIIDFQACQTNELQCELVSFDVRSCLDECARVRQPGKNVRFHIEVGDYVSGQLFVLGDQAHLKQILANLCSNALKFTEEGDVVLSCCVARPTKMEDIVPGSLIELLFEVKDSGIGIAKEEQANLFQAFSQVDRSSTRRHSGTGMGLALSQRLTELISHGESRIECTSQLGEGSTFTFKLKMELSRIVSPTDTQRQVLGDVDLSTLQGYLCSSDPILIRVMQREIVFTELPCILCETMSELCLHLQDEPKKEGRVIVVDARFDLQGTIRHVQPHLSPEDRVILLTTLGDNMENPHQSQQFARLFYPPLKCRFSSILYQFYRHSQNSSPRRLASSKGL